MIPYGRQHINQADIDAVVNVLTSDWLTQGPMVPRFEEALAAYSQVPYAVAVNSATSALHIACLALGVGVGDSVWTVPNTFVASANCALYCGAQVDFVDIDAGTFNMSVDALTIKLQAAAVAGNLPKVVIPVHFAGQSCAMREIHALSKQYGFRIIEDASHAVGASYLEAPVGNCRFSDITIFSFHPVKIITTGEGGVALTKSQDLYERMQLLRSHGITRDARLMENKPDGAWYYEQVDLGFNYRMTDMQAALGVSQLQRLDEFIGKRRELAASYRQLLAPLALRMQQPIADANSSWHLMVVQLESATVERGAAFDFLRQQGIGVNVHYMPVYLQPYYRRLGFEPGYCPVAEEYYRKAISLPMYPQLTTEQMAYIVKTLGELLA